MQRAPRSAKATVPPPPVREGSAVGQAAIAAEFIAQADAYGLRTLQNVVHTPGDLRIVPIEYWV